jgi:Uma2 family endonuclease
MPRNAAANYIGLTVEEYANLPYDDIRTELVRGRVIREPQPAFEHGRLQARIAALLDDHIQKAGLDLVAVGTFGVITSELPATVRGPDAAVIHRSRLTDLHHAGFLRGAPDLAVEIVSPSNRPAEIADKAAEYLATGARAVWVVYPRSRTVAVHTSTQTTAILCVSDTLDGGYILPGLRLSVALLFNPQVPRMGD